MVDDIQQKVACKLDQLREPLVFRVAESLSVDLPMGGEGVTLPSHHLATTVRRFHALVQVGVTLDWQLVVDEYEWGRRVLSRYGVTWVHQHLLIATYFTAAHTLREWQREELVALADIAEHLRQICAIVYNGPIPALHS